MLKNYFKTALRSLYKHKSFTLINIFGLSIGIAMATLMGRFIQEELSYDQFYKDKAQLYRVYQESSINGRDRVSITGSGVMAPTLSSSYPEIELAGRTHRVGSAVIEKDGKQFIENFLAYADDDFLELMEFKFLEGNPGQSLTDPLDFLISEALAMKIFGKTTSLLGESITINDKQRRITGVIANMPENSHYSSKAGFLSNAEMGQFTWNRVGHVTYVKLAPGTDIEQLESKFPQLVTDNILPILPEESSVVVKLYPINDIWLSDSARQEGGGSKSSLISFGLIAFFILLIASINYMNLATARSLRRVKEIGMRKVIGAKKSHLIMQFLTESVVLCIGAILIGGFLAEMCTGIFNDLTGKTVEIGLLKNSGLLLTMLAFGLALGVVSGLYPAFYISSFKPTRVLKGANSGSRANTNVRRVLVSLQFIISIGLIVSTLVVYKQGNFLLEKDLGYNSEQVLAIRLAKSDSSGVMKSAILSLPNVSAVTATNLIPAGGDNGATFTIVDESNEVHKDIVSMASIDTDYLSTMEFKLLNGRNFSNELATDNMSIIVNETLVKKYQWSDPLGKKLTMNTEEGIKEFSIIGVVKDFNMLSLYEPVKPFAFFLKPTYDWGAQYLFAKLSVNDVEVTLEHIQGIYEDIEKNRPYGAYFLDQRFEAVYQAEVKKSEVYFTFSMLTIVIACIGLFGLAAFVLQQKIKEISIRKVLGANLSDIIGLVSKEFIYIIVISTLIASPLAYYFMQEWLQSFEYRIDIGFGLFIIAGLSALVVAMLTIGIQSLKTAQTNPVDTLKYD
jgi:putative ABC transport system permease protein